MAEVLWRRTARGAVLRRPGTDDFVLLDVPGSELWEVLDRPRTGAELTYLLASRFEAEVDSLSSDVDAALRDLRVRGLVTGGPA